MTDTPTRVLPADVYDTLELVAYGYGGIGAVWLYGDNGEPYCAYGAAEFATDTGRREPNPVAEALRRCLHRPCGQR